LVITQLLDSPMPAINSLVRYTSAPITTNFIQPTSAVVPFSNLVRQFQGPLARLSWPRRLAKAAFQVATSTPEARLEAPSITSATMALRSPYSHRVWRGTYAALVLIPTATLGSTCWLPRPPAMSTALIPRELLACWRVWVK